MVRTIGVLGGTGFVGQHLVGRLAEQGVQVRVLSRHPQRHRELLVLRGVEIVKSDVHDAAQLKQHLQGCDAVINLIGILNQAHKAEFQQVHGELPGKLVDACRAAGITRLLHMSALNADPHTGASRYLRSKGEGEVAVNMAEGLQVTVFRPSVIFGKGDSFFNRFAALLRLSPWLALVPCPHAKFAPVWVDDVVAAMLHSLQHPAQTAGQSYDLCGPRTYTMLELMGYTARQIGARRRLLPLGPGLSRLLPVFMDFAAFGIFQFSRDNYLSMQTPSVCEQDGFAALGLRPHSVEAVVPGYLGGREQRARYDRLRLAARRG